MKRYFLYDTVIQSDKTPSFGIAARALIDFLKLSVPSLKGAKADLGSEIMALDTIKFIERNAYTLSLAAREKGAIVCCESSAFISLQLTKEVLSNDAVIRDSIALKLSHDGMELDFQTEVVRLETFLMTEVGIEKLSSLVKHSFSNFNIAHFLGTSFCQARKFTDMALTCKLVEMIHAKKVAFTRVYESDGFEVLDVCEDLAKKLASETMLDMFDTAADIVLVDDARSFIMFDFYQKALEKTASREIELPVLNIAQLLLLAFGVTEKATLGLDKHKIKATLV